MRNLFGDVAIVTHAIVNDSPTTDGLWFERELRENFDFSLPASVIGTESAGNYSNAAVLEQMFREQLGLTSSTTLPASTSTAPPD